MDNKQLTSMHQPARLLSTVGLFLIVMLSGCASINSGLQSGTLPTNGAFVAENGIQFNVQSLSLATIPAKQAVVANDDLIRLIKSASPVNYRITQGDILSIVLIGYPDITVAGAGDNPYGSGYPVDQQGFIQYPLIGRIKASGLSVPVFTANLQAKLQRYLKHSDPQVKIVNYRGNKFFIDGEVNKPG